MLSKFLELNWSLRKGSLNDWPGFAEKTLVYEGESKVWDAEISTAVISALKKQYDKLGLDISDATEKLESPQVRTVTTGHQLQLLGGPAFLHYKTIATIRKALALQSETGSPVVPVFWMASEDHDFAEISWVYGRDKKFNWQYPDSVEGKPVGKLSLKGIREVAGEWIAEAGISEDDAETILHCLDVSEKNEESYAQFFNRLMHAWYGDLGLVVIDAAAAEFKNIGAELLRDELYGNGVAEAVRKTSEEIKASGGKAQAHIRDISLFHMPKDEARVGIVDAEKFKGTPMEELSPSVLLRPLYQELLLPNCIVVLGPGEAAYWQQLVGAFETKGIAMPELHLRDHALWLSARNEGMVVWPKVEELQAAYVEKVAREKFAEEFAALEKAVADAGGAMEKVVGALDQSLQGAKGAAEAGLNKALKAFFKKAKRAVRRGLEKELAEIESAAKEVVRDGAPQDRWANLHVLSAGAGGFINTRGKLLSIHENIEPVMVVFDESN